MVHLIGIPLVVPASVGWLVGRRISSSISPPLKQKESWARLLELFIMEGHAGWRKCLVSAHRNGRNALSLDLSLKQREVALRWYKVHLEDYRHSEAAHLMAIADYSRDLDETRSVGEALAAAIGDLSNCANSPAPNALALFQKILSETTILHDRVFGRHGSMLDEVMTPLLSRSRPRLAKQGVELEILEWDLTNELALILPHELVMIVEALITNSCEAMTSGNPNRIRVSGWATIDKIFLCIEDSGPGWAGGDRSRFLVRGVTTKKQGTGLGLHHASEILKKYLGSLALEDGRDGSGARVVLTLKRIGAPSRSIAKGA